MKKQINEEAVSRAFVDWLRKGNDRAQNARAIRALAEQRRLARPMTIAHAGWTPTGEGAPEWMGTCQRCGARVAAIRLLHRLRAFGKGEWITCRDGCDAHRFDRR